MTLTLVLFEGQLCKQVHVDAPPTHLYVLTQQRSRQLQGCFCFTFYLTVYVGDCSRHITYREQHEGQKPEGLCSHPVREAL